MSFLSEGQLIGLAYVISSLAALVWSFRRKAINAGFRHRKTHRSKAGAIESEEH